MMTNEGQDQDPRSNGRNHQRQPSRTSTRSDDHQRPPMRGPIFRGGIPARPCTTIATWNGDDDTNGSRGHDAVDGHDEDDGCNRWGKIVAVGLAAAGGLSLVAAAPFVTTQLRSPLPYMATPRRKVVAALDAIASGRLAGSGRSGGGAGAGATSTHRRRRPHLTDLGSGDGEAVLAAAASECGWTATGVELNPTLWAVSSLRRWTSLDADARRRARFVRGDMFSLLTSPSSSSATSLLPPAAMGGGGGGGLLGSSDAVMIFGVRSLMGRVARLLREGGASPGTYVLSYRFRLPIVEDGPPAAAGSGENDDDDGDDGRIDATLVYDVEDMRVYVLNGGRGVDGDDDGGGGGGGRGA